jgi:ADP-ribose pyrophosphatase
MNLDEKITASEPIYKGKIVDLRLLDVQLADGTEAKREMVYHGGAVAVVPFDDDGNVLLVRQYRHGAGKVLLELPAGGLNVGEEPKEAARRELQEEISYKPETLIYLGTYYVAAAYTTEAIAIYLGRDLVPADLAPDVDERIVLERKPFKQALNMALTNEIEDAKTLIGLMWAAKHITNNNG